MRRLLISACARLFKTGDFARVEKNILIFEGRTDSQVKVRGNRVDMAEIQTALDKFSCVEKFSVLCYKPASMEQEIVAFVKLRSQGETRINAIDLEDELHGMLHSYAVPKIVIIREFPLLTNGKVDRQTLLKEFESNRGNSAEDTLAEIDYTGIEIGQITAAKCLFETVARVLGNSIRNFIGRESNFYELGGNSLNSIYTVTQLQSQGYEIGIAQFIRAKNLGEVLNAIYSEEDDPKCEVISMPAATFSNYETEREYQVEMLTENHKADVIKMISDSFYNKADLEMWLEPKPEKKDYEQIIELMWKPLVEKKLSPIVKSASSQKYVGVALNFDLYDEPPVELNNNILNVVFEFLEFVEKPVREEKLPVGKRQVLHSFMLATAEELNAAQNVEVVALMEREIIKIAKSGGFAGIFTTNTSPLTQQLGTDVFGYKTLSEMKANDYVADGNFRPFAKAPDDQVVRCSWKRLY